MFINNFNNFGWHWSGLPRLTVVVLALSIIMVGLTTAHLSLARAQEEEPTPSPNPTAIPAPPPSATMSINSGPGGTNVRITGRDFVGSGLSVTFGSHTVASNVNPSGPSGAINVNFTAPRIAAGRYPVRIGSFTLGDFVLTNTFTVSPASGPPGTSVRVRGTGFNANSQVDLNIGGVPWQSLVADEDGELRATLQIPQLAEGSKQITVSGARAMATFDVTPAMFLSEPTGSPGNTIKISGVGFGANQSGITISFDNDIIASVASNALGSWTLAFTIPPVRKGTYVIKASGSGTEPEISFTVAAGLFINKPQAAPGESVTVSGGGFAPNETGIVLKLGDATIASGVAASAQGSWVRSFAIPPLPAGSYSLTSFGARTPAASVIAARLDIITSVAAASLSLHQAPADGATGVMVAIDRVVDHGSGEDVPALLGAFQAQLTYDASCINILHVRELDFTIAAIKIDNNAGQATFNGFSTGGTAAPAQLGHALTRLVGSARQNCSMEVAIENLNDRDGNGVGASPPGLNLDILRGDARADGVVDVADVLFIAQYLVDERAACTSIIDTTCMHSVNAAGVRHDGAFDQKGMADALILAQYLAGLRDEFFNRVTTPGAGPELGREFRLGAGDSAILESESLKLTFQEVSEDSRCPSDVVCVWEGLATIVGELSARGQRLGPFSLTLQAGRPELATQVAGRYRVTLAGLEPYPTSTHQIQPQEYRATLVIHRAE